ETKEVVNYRKAIFQGYDLVKKQGFLSVNDIVHIQQKLVDNTAGIRRITRDRHLYKSIFSNKNELKGTLVPSFSFQNQI
ncbi:MAG: hypothetical protein RLZZ414_1099, partial [Bacteroidota bacterium]